MTIQRTASTGVIARGVSYVEFDDLAMIKKFVDGTVTAADVIGLVARGQSRSGTVGNWWGSIGDDEWDYYDDEQAPWWHADSGGGQSPDQILEEYKYELEQEGSARPGDASIAVVMFAEHPFISGTYWNPLTDNRPLDGHNSQSYVPEGTPLKLIKVEYSYEGLYDPVTLPAQGMSITAAEIGGRLPYTPSEFGYVWYDNGDGSCYAESRDGQVTLFVDTQAGGGQVSWSAEDDFGVVETGNFSGMTDLGNLDGILYRADRLLSEFDSRPVIPAKTDSYNKDYTEDFPNSYPEPDFRG